MSEGFKLPQSAVPAFGCVVYVADVAGGGVRARVANLAGIEATADSERGALAKIVPAFKARVAEALARGEPIGWIEPVPEPEPGERRRFVPVHL
jgi:hypothetical protein